MHLVSFGDYTIPQGTTVNANMLTTQSGVLTINGTLNVSSNVSLLNFTTVIINGSEGQIFWQNNSDLRFNASVTITILNNAPGLQPVGGNASKRLIIGTTIISVSNNTSNNAAFSFAEFNAAGGLPQFLISAGTTICYGTVFTATLTPVNNTLNYDCSWSVNNGGSVSPATVNNFNLPQTITFTPTNSASQKTYTISCSVRKAGDPDAITTKTLTVIVNPAPAAPTGLTAAPPVVCAGSPAAVSAISAGNTINWYAASSGGTAFGNVNSGSNFSVSPAVTTTYFAAARLTATGCESVTRPSVTVTVDQPSAGGTISGAAVVCSGANTTTLTLTGFSGTISRWESSGDNFATTPVQIPFTGAALTVNNLTIPTYYRAVVQNGICSAAWSNVVLLAVANPGNWLGVDTDWNNPLNWCNGQLPNLSTDVVIPNGLLYYPVINGTGLVNNLTIATGGNASITVNNTLRIAGAIHSIQGIRAANGTIDFAGNTPQSFRADAFESAAIGRLVISNSTANASALNPSVAILPAGGSLSLIHQLSFGNVSNAVMETGDQLVLLSSALGTAAVADLTNDGTNSGNTLSGKLEIQRFIPGRRAWRLLSAPVSVASGLTLHNSWQEGAVPVSNPAIITSVNNPNPGYGTHITFGLPATNGYDQGINGNTSIRYLTASGWTGVPAATNSGVLPNTGLITDQPGYMLFVRGDRGTPLSAGVAAVISPTVLRMKGFIRSGQLDLPLHAGMSIGSSQFRVVGNPYPSAVNFHKLLQHPLNQAAGFEDAFYTWDAKLTGTNGVGGWVALSYNSITGSYDRTALSGGLTGADSNGDIQSGSAIVIDYPGTAASLRLEEPHKSNGSNSNLFRPSGPRNELRVQLIAKNADQTESVNDAVLVTFNDQWEDGVTRADMRKLSNFAENISIIKDQQSLVLERRRLLKETDSIAFGITQMRAKTYSLEIDAAQLIIPEGSIAVLEDRFLQQRTVLKLPDVQRVDFTVNNQAGSSRTDRFVLLIQPLVQFAALAAREKEQDVQLKWTAASSLPELSAFEIQRSADGIRFETITRMASAGAGISVAEFVYTDVQPGTGIWYYRVKAVAASGVSVYSRLAVVDMLNTRQGIFVYPNPLSGREIQVRFGKVKPGRYRAVWVDGAGRQLQEFSLIHPGGSRTSLLQLQQKHAPGMYRLQVYDIDGRSTSIPVMITD